MVGDGVRIFIILMIMQYSFTKVIHYRKLRFGRSFERTIIPSIFGFKRRVLNPIISSILHVYLLKNVDFLERRSKFMTYHLASRFFGQHFYET